MIALSLQLFSNLRSMVWMVGGLRCTLRAMRFPPSSHFFIIQLSHKVQRKPHEAYPVKINQPLHPPSWAAGVTCSVSKGETFGLVLTLVLWQMIHK